MTSHRHFAVIERIEEKHNGGGFDLCKRLGRGVGGGGLGWVEVHREGRYLLTGC